MKLKLRSFFKYYLTEILESEWSKMASKRTEVTLIGKTLIYGSKRISDRLNPLLTTSRLKTMVIFKEAAKTKNGYETKKANPICKNNFSFFGILSSKIRN